MQRIALATPTAARCCTQHTRPRASRHQHPDSHGSSPPSECRLSFSLVRRRIPHPARHSAPPCSETVRRPSPSTAGRVSRGHDDPPLSRPAKRNPQIRIQSDHSPEPRQRHPRHVRPSTRDHEELRGAPARRRLSTSTVVARVARATALVYHPASRLPPHQARQSPRSRPGRTRPQIWRRQTAACPVSRVPDQDRHSSRVGTSIDAGDLPRPHGAPTPRRSRHVTRCGHSQPRASSRSFRLNTIQRACEGKG